MTSMLLEAADGEVIVVDVESAKGSGLIKNILDTCGIYQEENTLVPLPNVDSDTLKLLVNWLQYHKNDAADININSFSNWDEVFFLNVDDQKLVEIIRASNFLDISRLFEMSCKEAAERLDTNQLIHVQLDAKKNGEDSDDSGTSN